MMFRLKTLKTLKREYKIAFKAMLLTTIILLTNFIQIWWLSFGEVQIVNFRCDAQLIGYKRYKADVFEDINFIFDIDQYDDKYVIMGDGTVYYNITGSTFTHEYLIEGIYNITLTAIGFGPSFDSEWLIIEVHNDEPNFDIGFTSVEYHKATYDFENYEIGETPDDWQVTNNEGGFYLDEETNIYPGIVIEGGIENLTVEDNESWKIQSEWTGGNYRFIEITLHFNQTEDHAMDAGEYRLYFSANESMALFGFNPNLGENEILFNGNYTNGQVITISYPNSLELFASYYIENWAYGEVIAIDWFKLERVYKGVQIVNDEFDHGKIIEMNFGTVNQYCSISTSFPGQLYGTIEFWYRTSDTRVGGKFYSNLLSDVGIVGIVQTDNKWFVGTTEITDPSIANPVPKPENNTWHHIRIDWNNGIYEYKTLYERFFSVYIDNNKTINFRITSLNTGLNQITFETRNKIDIDAIGYSWDDHYSVGENRDAVYPEHLYEDLDITFSVLNLEESEFDKKGFSFNSEAALSSNFSYIWDFGDGNYSYDESPTHKFQNAGEFPVRLTLVDDQGAMSTRVKIFIIENKEPTVDINYGLNYDATYDFKYDVSGRPPNDWSTHGDIKVIDFKDEFSKVVEVDTLSGGYGLIRIPEPEIGLNGSIEFWIYFTDTENDEFFFWIDKLAYSDMNLFALKNSTRFGFLNGKWMYYYTYKGPSDEDRYAYGEMAELGKPLNNKWTHVRFDYSWSNLIEYRGLIGKQWRVSVNGTSSNIYDGVGKIYSRKGFDIRSGSHIYLDSLGFTTDRSYKLGDNNPERRLSYYGTWDFRSYPNGPIPYDETLQSTVLGPWMFGSYNFEEFANNCSAYILPELDGHDKVLQLKDNNNSDLVFASLIDYSKPSYGTIEFWLRVTDVTQGLAMAFGHQVFDTGIWLTNNGNWEYKYGNNNIEISDVPNIKNNTWHHIRIDFDCRENGGYLGLDEDHFYFAVDGNYSELSPFEFTEPVSNFAWNIWSTLKEGYNYSIFLDAIGGSWDPAYSAGDNMQRRETIPTDTEIIFYAEGDDTPIDKENLKYVWNFGDNQTTFGQTVLHTFTRSGKYNIKLVAIDDNEQYGTDEKFIWIDNVFPTINILDINYGYATYEFSTNDVGEFPDGWFGSSLEDIYRITEIVGYIGGFSKVVQIGNGPGLGGIWTSDVIGVPYNQTESGDLTLKYGTIEFWLYCTDTSQSNIYFSLFQDTYLDGIFIEFNAGTWTHDSALINFESSWILQNSTWTHFRIDFACDNSSYLGLDNDTFIITADGFSSQVLHMIHNNHTDISNITCIGLFTDIDPGDFGQVYLDNIGFSWDPEYTVGDNKYFYKVNQFNEGETIILDCLSYDSFTDYQQLSYNWGDLYLDIGAWPDFGWHYSFTFTDNDDGDALEGYPVVSIIGDPLYAWDIDSYYINVNDVLPELSIHSVEVVTNITASILNYGTEAANFTIMLGSSSLNRTIFGVVIPENYPDDTFNLNSSVASLDVSEDWYILVNQTARQGGSHEVFLEFNYDNGYTFETSHVFDGTESIWTYDINNMWIDEMNNLSNVPLTFGATISDPSDDKINLSIYYSVRVLYEVDYSTPLISQQYLIPNDSNDISCYFNVYEDIGKKYASFKFVDKIPESWRLDLISGIFPVAYDFNFKADMTNIDIYAFTNSIFNDNGITGITLIATNYSIDASYNEIQPISEIQNEHIGYFISEDFIFDNLAPSITIIAPVNVTEDQMVIYKANIEDFNDDEVSVTFSFGINRGSGLRYLEPENVGNNQYILNYTYKNSGQYLIYVNATDGKQESRAIYCIDVINIPPYAKIRTYQNSTSEDEYIKFMADFYDTESDIDSLRYYWDFGDGVFSAEESPYHAYYQAGDYIIRLFVKDNNGGTFCAQYNLTVIEEPPKILGPFSLTGVEGQVITLGVDASDSSSDILMNYTWDIYKARKIFQATYDFMEFNAGSLPNYNGFQFNGGLNVNCKVVEEVSNHYKVLELTDNNDQIGGSWSFTYGSSSSYFGTIEFWLRSSNISPDMDNFMINLIESGSGVIPILIGDNGSLMYYNNYLGNYSMISELPPLSSNIWHHFRIDYDCGTNNYMDLGEDQWRLTIDGISSKILNMQFGSIPNDDVSSLDTIKISTGAEIEMSLSCDAVGYANGALSYQVGDNFYPKLQSFEFLKTIQGKNPSIAFNEGSYLLQLTVENSLSSTANISLEVLNIAPIITATNKQYYGDTGYIDVTAYALDSFIDSESLEFEWSVQGRRVIKYGTLSSTINVFCNATKRILGTVTVRDPLDLTASYDFFVQSFLDSNGDGLTNEYEILHKINSTDMDNDGLPNFYEIDYLNTSISDVDTDDDGLWDGYDGFDNLGELSYGTDPLNNDTDNDELLDGFEAHGWSHTIYTNEGAKNVTYTSNPLKRDTDRDLLSDNEEFLYKTNPRRADTDNDYLTDYEEIYIYKSDPNNPDCDADGLLDGIEFRIGSLYNESDTDGDSIGDGEEYYGWDFVTNPLLKDSDNDFLPDNEEYYSYLYEIDGRKSVEEPVILNFPDSGVKKACSAGLSFLLTYGEEASSDLLSDFRVLVYKFESKVILFDELIELSDNQRYYSHTIDIKDKIESSGKGYKGDYVLKISYKHPHHGSLCLEEYSINVLGYLDPNEADYDHDGIMDGVETKLIVPGIEHTMYDDVVNLTADTNSTTFDIYQIELSDVGFVKNAQIKFTVKSNQTLTGNGGVAITVTQKKVDVRVPYRNIHFSNETFVSSTSFEHNYTIDPYTVEPYGYEGFYFIKIDIFDISLSDVFILSDLTIETDGYRKANSSDTQAWLTNPNKKDTDGDGWWDKYEITRSNPTNPLAWDSDGDGVKDSKDYAPLQNIMLKVTLEEGHIDDLPLWYIAVKQKPELQLTVSFSIHDTRYAYVTPQEQCDSSSRKGWDTVGITYWRTATFNYDYYIDIEDDRREIMLQFALWDEGIGDPDEFWDTERLVKSYSYDIKDYGIGESYSAKVKGGDYSSNDYFKYTVETLGVSHANTIAVYNNLTLFNGHYNERDRMHIFELTVTDYPDSDPISPFKHGLNFILIPNKDFVRTKLNSIIQNESKFTSSILTRGEFISLDREDLPETASNNIESIFALECTGEEALMILNWTVLGLINETSGEIGIINSYGSTKLDDYKIELMNVHEDILLSIPGIIDDLNSPIGSPPEDFYEWGANLLELVVKAIKGILSGDFAPLVELIGKLYSMAQTLFKVAIVIVAGPFAPLVILAFKVAEFIQFYIMFGIIIGIMTDIIFRLGTIFIWTVLGGNTVEWTVNKLSVTPGFTLGYDVGSEWSDFYSCDMGTLRTYFESDDWGYECIYKWDNITLGFTKSPDTQAFNDTIKVMQFFSVMGEAMDKGGSTYDIIGPGGALAEASYGISVLAAVAGVAGVLIYFLVDKASDIEEDGPHINLGIGIGFLISAFAAFLPQLFVKLGTSLSSATNAESLKKVLDPVDDLCENSGKAFKLLKFTEVLNLDEPTELLKDLISNLVGGATSLVIGCTILVALEQSWAIVCRYVLACIYLALGVYYIMEFINNI